MVRSWGWLPSGGWSKVVVRVADGEREEKDENENMEGKKPK